MDKYETTSKIIKRLEAIKILLIKSNNYRECRDEIIDDVIKRIEDFA